MGRKYDLVDVMAAIGLVATLFGGYLLVTAADGFWQAPSAPTMTTTTVRSGPSTGMEYLQPVLGRAILQDMLLDRTAGAALSASTMELNRAVNEYQRLSTTLLSPLVLAELTAFGQEGDHHARVQFVMGKSVVNHTRRGIASGILSADQYLSDFNTSLIRTAEATGQRMHDQFEATRQAILGRSIVEAVQEEERMAITVQERIGRAIMQVSQAQEFYEGAKAAQQTQLASAAIAAVRTEAIMELALLEDMPGEPSVAAHHSSATADISRGSLILACLGLISLFVGGLAFGNRKSDVESIPIWKLETLLQLQRSGR
ncbi:MAG: hypothetical protein M3M98_01325 [Nitrospirota bacterium]|nr:hypothetical protein [Nitrospirota bacterium]